MVFQTVCQEVWHMWSRCVIGAAVGSKEKGSVEIQDYEKLFRAGQPSRRQTGLLKVGGGGLWVREQI
jgi:hypothetical protein